MNDFEFNFLSFDHVTMSENLEFRKLVHVILYTYYYTYTFSINLDIFSFRLKISVD